MLGKLPSIIGHALRSARAGSEKLAFNDEHFAAVTESVEVDSQAFDDGGPIPVRYTADGAQTSPPLGIRAVPPGTASVVLLIEDADSPTPEPLVHAIAWHLPNTDTMLEEGALQKTADEAPRIPMGKNSFWQDAYLPPDPPPGHGPHRYVFQVFALDKRLDFDSPPGRTALLAQMRDHVIAKGSLTGIYERSSRA